MHYISATNFNDLNARFSDDSDDDCIIVQVDEAADVPKGKFVNFYATALLSSADMTWHMKSLCQNMAKSIRSQVEQATCMYYMAYCCRIKFYFCDRYHKTKTS